VADGLSTAQFRRHLESVAAGSNEGDARRTADCFAEDAVYIEPPDCEFVGESLF
jgi:ketosteroid isomerase-like protein